MTVQEEVTRRIAGDPLLIKLRRKIDSGNADFKDTAAYSNRAADIMSEIFARRLPEISLAERETLCVELLHDRHTDINELLGRVQRSLDDAQGLHIAPQHAPFNAERAHQIGSSTADPTKPEETRQRRARSATATAARAMHDDYVKKNAEFRSKAGLKCYINREAVPACCEWCDKMAGRFEYGEEPDDIYRRHDNCGCSVTFENGRQRQDVWSKREWEAPEPGAGAGEPVVLTEEQAERLQAEKGLTILQEDDTIKSEMRHTGLSGRIFQSVQQLFSGNPSAISEEYLESLPKLSKPDTIMRALRLANPSKDEENCARCVPAYEMRRRGYDVFAAKAPKNWRDDNIGISDFRKVFLNMDWKECGIDDRKEIESFLLDAGHGSRAEISLKTKRGLHLFVAENDNGKIRFIDPQKSLGNVEFYFNYPRVGKTEFVRIDNLEPSALIKDCLEVTL